MASRAQNSFDFNAYYKSACTYGWTWYNQTISWVGTQSRQLYAKWPSVKGFFTSTAASSWDASKKFVWSKWQGATARIPATRAFIRTQAWASYSAGRTFVGNHLKGITFICGAGVSAGIFYRYWKNRPEYPQVTLVSSLDRAILRIAVPKAQVRATNAALTFCIDTSGSMRDERRLEIIQEALGAILEHAQGVVNKSSEARIGISIVKFENASEVVTPFSRVESSQGKKPEETEVSKIKGKIQGLKPGGGTDILAGLDKAVEELTKTARSYPQSSHTLVLLTDGGSGIDSKRLAAVHQRLMSNNARLFAIGIGNSHEKDKMKQIVGDEKSAFRGEYFDTTQPGVTIEGSINMIYQQAIASFKGLTLTSPQLPQGRWTIANATRTIVNGQQERFDLGSQDEGTVISRGIRIHSEQLPAPVDLSEVMFNISFIDPRGRRGTLTLPWGPTTNIDPQLLREAVKP